MKTKSISAKVQARINQAIIQIKADIGFEFCVCFLTNGHPPSLMISNIPRNYKVEDHIQERITKHLFPNLEFNVTDKDIGPTLALVFTPVLVY